MATRPAALEQPGSRVWVVGRPSSVVDEGQMTIPSPTSPPQAHGRGPQWPDLAVPRGALDEHVGIPFDVEPKRPPEIDVREVRRADPPQPALIDPDAVTPELCHDAVHETRVPGQHDVGQQRVCARDGRQLLPTAAALGGHLTAMNCPLQLVGWASLSFLESPQGAQDRRSARQAIEQG